VDFAGAGKFCRSKAAPRRCTPAADCINRTSRELNGLARGREQDGEGQEWIGAPSKVDGGIGQIQALRRGPIVKRPSNTRRTTQRLRYLSPQPTDSAFYRIIEAFERPQGRSHHSCERRNTAKSSDKLVRLWRRPSTSRADRGVLRRDVSHFATDGRLPACEPVPKQAPEKTLVALGCNWQTACASARC